MTIIYRKLPNGQVVVPKELLKKWYQVLLSLAKLYGRNYFVNGFKSGDLIACINPDIIKQYIQGMGSRHAVGLVRYSPTEPAIILFSDEEQSYLTFTNNGETPSSKFRARLQRPNGCIVDLDRLNALDWNTEKFNLFKQVADMRNRSQTASSFYTPRETKEKKAYSHAVVEVRWAVSNYRKAQNRYNGYKRHLLPLLRQYPLARIKQVLSKRYDLDFHSTQAGEYNVHPPYEFIPEDPPRWERPQSIGIDRRFQTRNYRVIRNVLRKDTAKQLIKCPSWFKNRVHTEEGEIAYTDCRYPSRYSCYRSPRSVLTDFSPWLKRFLKIMDYVIAWWDAVHAYHTHTLEKISTAWAEYRYAVANYRLRIKVDADKIARKQALMEKRAEKAGKLMEETKFDRAVNELKSLIWDIEGERYLTQRKHVDGSVDPEPQIKEDTMNQEQNQQPVAMDGEVLALVGNIVVMKTTYKGQEKIDVRRLYENGDGALHPTKQGIRLSKEQWAAITEAIQAAIA